LAGGIAHDFNNLLVGILGNAGLALMELTPESPARYTIEQIEVAGQRAAELARQMLAYSGKGRFVIQRLNLNAVVEEMTHLLQVSIAKNVVLKYNFAPALPAVEADATQLRQVVMNLVVNASEAIGSRSGVITITTGAMHADRSYLNEIYTAPDLPEGDYVYLEIADTGSGMDAETREKVFDPFFTTKFTGRGLGLAAVLGIVRGHQGAIKVYSEPGRGTTFKVLLPCASGDLEANPAPLASSKVETSFPAGGLVLVIDDDETVRNVTARILREFGLTALLAADGRTGLEMFRRHASEISCVLLDLTMPNPSGEEVFREIRRTKRSVRVILMSGYNEQDATNRFAGKGLAGFLQKPFTPKDLRKKLEAALATK
jgi:CheY-like chemotaxis protein